MEKDKSIEDISGFNKFSLTAHVNFGFHLKLNDTYGLRIQPNVNYQVLKITETPITAKFRSIGTSFIFQMNR